MRKPALSYTVIFANDYMILFSLLLDNIYISIFETHCPLAQQFNFRNLSQEYKFGQVNNRVHLKRFKMSHNFKK